MTVNIKLQGEHKLIARIDKIDSGLSDFRKPLRESSQLMLNAIDRNFTAKGSELGKRWKTRKRSYAHPILNKSGKMKGGFKDKVTRSRAVIDNPVSYFPYHQLGTSQLPQRVMMRIDRQRTKQISNIFNKYVKKITK